jgi:hypothetical protein
MKELEAERERREKTNTGEVAKQKEPRASSTDSQARVMKMADGGFRPAYNMQIVSAVEGQMIVAVDVETERLGPRLGAPGARAAARGGTRARG